MSSESGEIISKHLQSILEGHEKIKPLKETTEADKLHIVGILSTLAQQQYSTSNIDSAVSILKWLFLTTHGKVVKANKTLLHVSIRKHLLI